MLRAAGRRNEITAAHTQSLPWVRTYMTKALLRQGVMSWPSGPIQKFDWKRTFDELGILYRRSFIERKEMNPLAHIRSRRRIR